MIHTSPLSPLVDVFVWKHNVNVLLGFHFLLLKHPYIPSVNTSEEPLTHFGETAEVSQVSAPPWILVSSILLSQATVIYWPA